MTRSVSHLRSRDRRDCLHWDVKWVSLYKSTQGQLLHSYARGKETDFKETKKKKGLNRMVATTDCEEKSKPIAGHKVCRETSWKELDLTVFYWRVLCAILILPAFSLQVSKPLMEKKRRARINKSLDQLKSLLESYYSSNVRIQIWSCFYFRPTENAVNVIIVLIRRKLSE